MKPTRTTTVEDDHRMRAEFLGNEMSRFNLRAVMWRAILESLCIVRWMSLLEINLSVTHGRTIQSLGFMPKT